MKINKKIRIKALKRMIKRYKKLINSISPFSHDANMINTYYFLIEYWEYTLINLKHGE